MYCLRNTQIVHLLVSHFEGGVKSAGVDASHLGACTVSFERSRLLAWALSAQIRQNIALAFKPQQKHSVGHTRSLAPATIQCKNTNIAQYPQKWYQVEALLALNAFMQTIIRITRACRTQRSFHVRVEKTQSYITGTRKAKVMKIPRHTLLVMLHLMV